MGVHEGLGTTPALSELGRVAQICHPIIRELEAGGSEIQNHPQLCSKFEASLSYPRPCFKKYINMFPFALKAVAITDS